MNDKERVEQVIWRKRLLVGKTKPTDFDPKPHNVYLEAEIKEKSDQRNWQTLKKMKKFRTFSISGTSKHFGGQIQDELTEKNINFTIDPVKVKQIKSIWKKWHLSDLKAGTKAQEKALSPKLRWASNYDKALKKLEEKGLKKHRGYQYGSGWLAEPLPKRVEKKIKEIF